MVYPVTEGIDQVIYWGDAPGYTDCRAMNYFTYKVYRVDPLTRENLVESQRLWIEKTDGPAPRFKAAPRIGIGYASKRDQLRRWRFLAQL